MDQKLRTERRKLADLKAAEYNPRKALTPDDAEYQKIRRSIEEFGYVDPIIINEDGTIIGGHQRATVLKDLGYQEVDVVVVALDKQREKALNIALNKITGEWDEVKLKDLLLDLDLGDYDISLTGFEQNDLTELVDKLAIEPEAVDDDFKGGVEPQEVFVTLLIGYFDDDAGNNGHKGVLGIIQKIQERFMKEPMLAKQFYFMNDEQHPFDWALQDEESFPYFFGAASMTFATAAIRKEDRFA